MSTDPRLAHVRALLDANQFAVALSTVREMESSGVNSPELEHAKGLCLAGLGRASEARVIARRLKDEGHVALAQRLADHISVEAEPEGLINDGPCVSPAPPYPKANVVKTSNALLIGLSAAGAALLLVIGVAVGSYLSKRPGVVSAAPQRADFAVATKQGDSAAPPAQLAVTRTEDPAELTGYWKSVDFVSESSHFKPGAKQFRGDLFLKEMTCFADGSSTLPMHWQNGNIVDDESTYRAEYTVQTIDGSTYLFLPWISGDVTVRGQKPKYYVMRKVDASQAQVASAHAPQQPSVTWQQASLDVTGSWRSVDFVSDPAHFVPGRKAWQGDLTMKGFQCYADGSAATSMMPFSWGSGWITDLNSGYKAQYQVWTANGQAYLFFPWLSGDVTIRNQPPKYYVLQHG